MFDCNFMHWDAKQRKRLSEQTIDVAVPEALLSPGKYFRRCWEYMQAYREGNSGGKDVEKAVKLCKSHRHAFGPIHWLIATCFLSTSM